MDSSWLSRVVFSGTLNAGVKDMFATTSFSGKTLHLEVGKKLAFDL
jgi:hypothetical protein